MSVATGSLSVAPSGGLHHELQDVISQMELLKVTELKAICRALDFPITGRKSILQDRIRAYLKNSLSIGHIDPWRPKAIKILIEKAVLGEVLPKYEVLWQAIRSGAYRHPVATGQQPVSSLESRPRASQGASRTVNKTKTSSSSAKARKTAPDPAAQSSTLMRQIVFKESPFYKLKKVIPGTVKKLTVTNGRGVSDARFKLTNTDWELLESDKKYRLYLLCGAFKDNGVQVDEPIQFPHPNDIRFNNVQIKDNIRGLKNKPGTAKPADLTPHVRSPPQDNALELIYAFTKTEFIMFCYIVEQVTPEELLKDVLKHPKIIRIATLNYLKKIVNEEDDEIMTTSTVMSLQCPISCTRMRYPSKSIMCKHLQCFDALWYIHSQLQVPTWQCPVCQIHIEIRDLAISEYVDDIIKECGENVEQVELSADGSWVPIIEEDDNNDDDEDHCNQGPQPSVKKEHTSDSLDGVEFPRAKSASARAHETVVISLDSDDVDDDDDDKEEEGGESTNVTPRDESTQTQSNNQANNAQTNELQSSVTRPSLSLPISGEPLSTTANNSLLNPSTDRSFPMLRDLSLDNMDPSVVAGVPSDEHANSVPRTTLPAILTRSNSTQSASEYPTLQNLAGAHNLLGMAGIAPSIRNLVSSPEDTSNNTRQQLPTLPPIGNGNVPVSAPLHQVAPRNLRGRKTIVSPFIPKKPYPSMLPQKRPNTNITTDNSRTGMAVENRAPLPSQPAMGLFQHNDNNNHNQVDVIDLTSDDV